ncbi:glycosyltransferase [Latilactobacillus curvatus]|uniref:glycosyltransferase n=4 Tax=Latilactobacillus curvatus TaxID=28038 RepID=UPI000AAFCE42|nr:glycosyltransferase [Latilactobacillus curvatus]MCM0725797.1 glycosyltransferase [Latilactobacillus curvatus]MCP8848830.1 glycosyltransferase [Latilactobacillus curvatus]MCP8850038.1 glycosyltransferase [Latilactobacillus curvatus]MCP8858444.1 glycosyltransferase [Latilactobacillus curvatus]MCP8860408.1 glycosyltransferase [Latilactobacillus curvatus]
MTNISVCMATYNGVKTLPKQIKSIIKQLTAQDEIVIIDDCSSDDTMGLLRELLVNFNGQTILKRNDQNMGPIKSFEKALGLATGNLVFLSDQDDEWHDDKVEIIQDAYVNGHADLIVHDATVIGKNGEVVDQSWNHYNHNQVDQSVFSNLIKNGYTGAMMAISRRLLDAALPFPEKIEMHDQWLFLVAKKNHFKITATSATLMDYVRHGGNVTGMSKRNKKEMLIGRLRMLNTYLKMKESSK